MKTKHKTTLFQRRIAAQKSWLLYHYNHSSPAYRQRIWRLSRSHNL